MTKVATPRQIFEQLSTSQRRFLLEKDISAEKALDEWLSFLKPIVAYDILLDNSTQKLKLALRLLLLMAIFNILVAAITQNVWIGALGMAMALLGLYQWFRRLGNQKRDLDNHLRLYFFPVLASLHEDGRSGMLVQATFHLREKDNAPIVIEALFFKGDQFVTLQLSRTAYEISTAGEKVEGQLTNPTELTQRVRQSINEFLA